MTTEPQSKPIESVLATLRSGDPSAAWKTFLNEYASLVMRIVRHHVRGEDDRSDCFLFVCERLCANQCARLLKFDPEGTARFSTWLTVVVGRLVIDWRRQHIGRERPYANIARLPALAQRLFHFRFERRLSRDECLAALRAEFGDLDATQFTAALTQVERTLSSDQRWRLGQRGAIATSLDEAESVAAEDDVEGAVDADKERARVDRAMAELDARERLLLLYRFEQDLSFDAIARLMGLGDAFRARRAVEASLAKLRARLET